MRAKTLEASLRNKYISARSSLFFMLYRTHHGLFHWQWSITVIQSVAAYGPQFCMYKMLRLLEQQHVTGIKPAELLAWAVGLGLVRLLQTLLEARYILLLLWLDSSADKIRLTWLSFSTIAVSIRSQLSAAICSKCMRLTSAKCEEPEACGEKDAMSSCE